MTMSLQLPIVACLLLVSIVTLFLPSMSMEFSILALSPSTKYTLRVIAAVRWLTPGNIGQLSCNSPTSVFWIQRL